MRKFTKYPSSYMSITSADRISLKENIYKYLSDDNVYKALNSYEQTVLTASWSSGDPQIYLLGAISAFNAAGIATTKEFKHIAYLVSEDAKGDAKSE